MAILRYSTYQSNHAEYSLMGTLDRSDISILRSSKLLAEMPEVFITSFIDNCHKRNYLPNKRIHCGGADLDLPFMVLLDGCIAVSQRSGKEKTIDALLTRAHVIGEFDFLGSPTKTHDLETLADTSAAVLDSSFLSQFENDSQDRSIESLGTRKRFYRALCLSLVDKLKSQNRLLKFRSNRFDGRLAKLLDNFGNREWRHLTNLTPDSHGSTYEIYVYFTQAILNGLVGGLPDGRSLRTNLGRLIAEENVSMKKFDKNHQPLGEAKSSDFGSYSFPHCEYFTLTVNDHASLSRYIHG